LFSIAEFSSPSIIMTSSSELKGGGTADDLRN
jgi:hypothetical protein